MTFFYVFNMTFSYVLKVTLARNMPIIPEFVINFKDLSDFDR